MGSRPIVSIVTGASSGIGAEYAWQLGTKRFSNLVLVARRIELLQQLAEKIKSFWAANHHSGEVIVFPCDIAIESERERLVAEIRRRELPIDVLVNNAGFGSLGEFTLLDMKNEQKMVQVNCIAPMYFMHEFLPMMARRSTGTIINVCSTAAFQPLTYMTTYGATKAFLCSFSLGVAEEVKRSGVHVLAHFPGPTATEFHIAAGLPAKIKYLNSKQCPEVVDEVLRAMDKRRRLVINGFGNRALTMLVRILPPTVSASVVEWLLRRYAMMVRAERAGVAHRS